jgi:malate synthase
MEVFDRVLGDRPHQKHRLRPEVNVQPAELARLSVPGGQVTEAGLRLNVSVALQYLDAWLSGNGAAAINNLMEDAATAEISRAQLWQWLKQGATLADGTLVTPALYEQVRAEELARLGGPEAGRLGQASELLDRLVLSPDFVEFLTLIAYPYLD